MSIFAIIANDFLIVINIVIKTLYDAVFAVRRYTVVGMSVRPSACLSVCLTRALCQHECQQTPQMEYDHYWTVRLVLLNSIFFWSSFQNPESLLTVGGPMMR